MVIYQLPSLFQASTAIAQGLVILGALISLWHYRLLKLNSADISTPESLVSRYGLYQWVRHPMYLGDGIAFLGLFLLVPNLLSVFVLVLAYVALFKQGKVEDAYMKQRFEREFKQWSVSSKLIVPYMI